MTPFSRRHMLGLLGGAAAMGAVGGLSACSSSTSASGAADQSIRFTWWGNELRNAQTTEAIAKFKDQNPGVTISEEPAEFSAYWDRLATQTAGGTAPDVIQMADGYIAEYGTRGALLDLTDLVDVSKFTEGTVDTGRIDGQLVGINAGINTPVILCNTAVLEKAGAAVPDDKTWTWDQYRDLAGEITAKAGSGIIGSSSPFAEGTLRAWLRQHGEELFTTEGKIGATEDTLRGYFEMMVAYSKAKAIPSAATVVEDSNKSLEQSSLVVDKAGFALFWSNQLAAVAKNAESDITMLRMPSVTGKPEDLKAWYHPSMLWSASAKTKNPELAGKIINWWVTSIDAASITLDERGFPANAAIADQIKEKLSPEGQAVATFLEELKPVLGDPQPIPPPGSGVVFTDVQTRAQDELLFGRITAAEAAKQFLDQATSSLQS